MTFTEDQSKFSESKLEKLTNSKLKELIQRLQSERNVDLSKFLIQDELQMSDSAIKEMMSRPVPFKINEHGELYISIDDETVIIDPRVDDLELLKSQQDLITDVIMECQFDVFCGGIRRKQNEVVAAYKTIIVNSLLEGSYQKKIDKILKGYDFDSYKNNIDESCTFVNLLDTIQQDSTPVIKFILACCSIVVSASKEKNDAPYINIVSQEDAEILTHLNKEISLKEADCSKALQNEPKKIKRLKLIEEKDKEIKDTINKLPKRIQIMFRINKLNSDSIPSIDKVFIRENTREICDEMLEKGQIINADFYNMAFNRISKKAQKAYVRKLKVEKFEIISDKNADLTNLLPKL